MYFADQNLMKGGGGGGEGGGSVRSNHSGGLWEKLLKLFRNSPWDWGQIGISLGTKHGIYQKLANFM